MNEAKPRELPEFVNAASLLAATRIEEEFNCQGGCTDFTALEICDAAIRKAKPGIDAKVCERLATKMRYTLLSKVRTTIEH